LSKFESDGKLNQKKVSAVIWSIQTKAVSRRKLTVSAAKSPAAENQPKKNWLSRMSAKFLCYLSHQQIQLSKVFTLNVNILVMHAGISHEIITYLPF